MFGPTLEPPVRSNGSTAMFAGEFFHANELAATGHKLNELLTS